MFLSLRGFPKGSRGNLFLGLNINLTSKPNFNIMIYADEKTFFFHFHARMQSQSI
jgi:hypothetical protein